MYRVSQRFSKIAIQERLVLKKTEKTVTFEGFEGRSTKEFLDSLGVRWFDDFNVAKQYAIKLVNQKLYSLKKETLLAEENREFLLNQSVNK